MKSEFEYPIEYLKMGFGIIAFLAKILKKMFIEFFSIIKMENGIRLNLSKK